MIKWINRTAKGFNVHTSNTINIKQIFEHKKCIANVIDKLSDNYVPCKSGGDCSWNYNSAQFMKAQYLFPLLILNF